MHAFYCGRSSTAPLKGYLGSQPLPIPEDADVQALLSGLFGKAAGGGSKKRKSKN
jgi:hypothetical protein